MSNKSKILVICHSSRPARTERRPVARAWSGIFSAEFLSESVGKHDSAPPAGDPHEGVRCDIRNAAPLLHRPAGQDGRTQDASQCHVQPFRGGLRADRDTGEPHGFIRAGRPPMPGTALHHDVAIAARSAFLASPEICRLVRNSAVRGRPAIICWSVLTRRRATCLITCPVPTLGAGMNHAAES